MFTDKYIKGLQPKPKKYTVTESTGERGESRLQVNVYPTGVKKFQIQYFLNKSRKRMEFGRFGTRLADYSLRDARVKFLELAAMVKDGIDPKKPIQQHEGMATLGELLSAYLTWYKAHRKVNSFNTISTHLRGSFETQADMNMPANEFTPDNAREIIYKVWNRGSKDMGFALRSALSTMFQFGIDYDKGPERFGKAPVFGIEYNPTRDINLQHTKAVGERFLTESEIYSLWHAKDMPPALHRFIRLNFALAGQRISEVAHSFEHEFHLDTGLFEIPVERVKIAKRGAHILPLSDLAIQIFDECRKFRSANGLLFPSVRDRQKPVPLPNLGRYIRNWLKSHPKFEPFTLRDIRRTCKTHMSKAGVNRDHRDMLQQHYKSDVATVHYDRYDYLQEKRQAMEVWTTYLKDLI